MPAQDILPFPPAPSGSQAGITIQSSTNKKRVERKHLADDAPNILIILMDDVGAGTPPTYGGEINTPTLDKVVNMGVSYNRFHSTTMCSPTRESLLTKRNPVSPDFFNPDLLRKWISNPFPFYCHPWLASSPTPSTRNKNHSSTST